MSEPAPTPSASKPKPARLRATDVIENQAAIIQALLTRSGGENTAVTLTRNAKGETQIEVTVRTDDTVLTTADAAAAKAEALYEHFCAKFPAGSGYVRNEGPR